MPRRKSEDEIRTEKILREEQDREKGRTIERHIMDQQRANALKSHKE